MTLSKNTKQFLKNSQNRTDFALFVKTVLNNPYIPSKPTDKQARFLLNSLTSEGFYGGSAGGGKSEALLMAALQFVEIPRYAALILRRTYADLSLPGALMDRAAEWLSGTDAQWKDKKKTWVFPSGASLTFGYLETEKDKFRYQGAEFQYVAFDELTQFTETQYQYLFSRTRRIKGVKIPIRIRSASNPGGIGHDWVKVRFIIPDVTELTKQERFFVPALLDDNPYLDRVTYCEALNKLDPVTREQLRNGNWDVTLSGGMFKREWFELVQSIPSVHQVRYWDLAATEPNKGSDPDYTVGCLMSEQDGKYYVKNIIRVRKGPGDIEKLILQTAQNDGIETRIVMEQEPGSSGVNTIDHYARHVLKGYTFTSERVTGSKIVRAQPLSAASANGNVKLARNTLWATELLYELEQFPNVTHDDQVDSMSGAFNFLSGNNNSNYAGFTVPTSNTAHIPGLGLSGGGIPGL